MIRALVILAALVLSLHACSTEKLIPNEMTVIVRDTVMITRTDTIYIGGDTVYVNDTETIYEVDTVYVHETDTVYVTVFDTIYIPTRDTVFVATVDTIYLENPPDTIYVTTIDTIFVTTIDTLYIDNPADTVYVEIPDEANCYRLSDGPWRGMIVDIRMMPPGGSIPLIFDADLTNEWVYFIYGCRYPGEYEELKNFRGTKGCYERTFPDGRTIVMDYEKEEIWPLPFEWTDYIEQTYNDYIYNFLAEYYSCQDDM